MTGEADDAGRTDGGDDAGTWGESNDAGTAGGAADAGTTDRTDGEELDGTGGRPDPALVVADADVLAADLLVGGGAREALDVVRAHSWIDLAASDPLLDDAEAVVAALADPELAADWRVAIEGLRVPVEHPGDDHPALASAYRAGAAHLLTFDEELTGADAGVAINRRLSLSIRTPDAFLAVFDPETLYPAVEDGSYPGPDRDPRGGIGEDG